jgi:hypothetical protein
MMESRYKSAENDYMAIVNLFVDGNLYVKGEIYVNEDLNIMDMFKKLLQLEERVEALEYAPGSQIYHNAKEEFENMQGNKVIKENSQ